jgi:hypothetical protein
MLKLRATRDAAGMSWTQEALITVKNAAWITYFALSRYCRSYSPLFGNGAL